MKRYTKIPPDEWIGEWGLSWIEAAVLADMLVWDCTIRERAVRCYISERTAYNAIAKIMSIEPAKNAVESLQNMQKKSAKYADGNMQNLQVQSAKIAEKQKEKKKTPPTPPIKNKKKIQQEQLLFPSMDDGGKEKKEEVKVYSLQYRCQKIFEQEFRQYKGCNYDYTGVDAGNLKMLLRRLKKVLTDKNGTEPTEDEQEFFFKDFIIAIIKFKPDKFVDDKFTLQNINSQFNVIYPKLINRNNGSTNNNGSNRKPTVSASFIEKHMRRAGLIVQPGGDK